MANQITAELYQQYANDIYRFCMFKTQSKELAEDLTSDVFLSLSEYRGEKIVNPRAWLYKVARNKIYDSFNSTKHSSITEDHENQESNDSQILDSSIHGELDMQILQECLALIDSNISDIIVLKTWDSLSFREIGKVLEISEDAAKKRYYRGIDTLKEIVNTPQRLKQMGITTLSSIGIVALLTKLSIQPTYAMSLGFVSSLGPTIISITTNNMVGNLAFSGFRAIGAFLSTTAGKAALVCTASVLAIGGSYVAINLGNNVDTPTPVAPQISEPKVVSDENESTNSEVNIDSTPDTVDPVICSTTYSNINYPGFSFEYDNCYWSISESEIQTDTDSTEVYPNQTEIVLTAIENDSSSLKFNLNPLPVFGFGPAYCKNALESMYSELVLRNLEDGGRYYIQDTNEWVYSGTLVSVESLINNPDSEILEIASFMDASFDRTKSGYCNAWEFATTTNYANSLETSGIGSTKLGAILSISFSGSVSEIDESDRVVQSLIVD